MVKATLHIYILIVAMCSCQVNTVQIRPDLGECFRSVPDTVTLFAEGIISTGLAERDMSISANVNEFFYTLGNYTQKRRAIFYIFCKNTQRIYPDIVIFSGSYMTI